MSGSKGVGGDGNGDGGGGVGVGDGGGKDEVLSLERQNYLTVL
jgi:hypothetical protein